MNILNNLFVTTLPLVPKSIVRRFANKYIAGDSLEDAVNVTKQLNDRGIMTTIDVLGEGVFSRQDAVNAKNECLEVLEAIDKNRLNANHSLKPTSLGLGIDYEFCLQNLTEIVKKANKLGQFVRIDMEDSPYTTRTLNLYEDVYKKYQNCGVVIQSYMRRSMDDVAELAKMKTNFRLCKGIYIEPVEIAYKGKQEVRDNYLKLLRLMFENNCYVGIATHDDYLIEGAYKMIAGLNKQKHEYEFQMLLGVRDKLRNKIVKDGHRMRIYVPFGVHWYKYSIRRFKENPNMAGYAFKALFTGGR
ncbi:MAG TPA: proline dehydrogenase family protein [Ignavibacteria bacterium]|jgi:proline dehydrogenase